MDYWDLFKIANKLAASFLSSSFELLYGTADFKHATC